MCMYIYMYGIYSAFIIKGINKLKTSSVEVSHVLLPEALLTKKISFLNFFQRKYQYMILNICFLTSSSFVPTQIPNILCFFSQCPVVYT